MFLNTFNTINSLNQKKLTFNHSDSNCHDIPRVDRKYFAAKFVASSKRYLELDDFRKEIEESRAGVHHQPYTTNKKTVLLYQSIFFGFTIFFAILTIGIPFIPSALGCGFFSFCTAVKSTLAIISAFFALTSFSIAFKMSTEREAILQGVRKAKTILATIYARKKIKMGIKRFFVIFTNHKDQAAALKHMYDEAYDKINEKKEHAFHLANRIKTAETLSWEEKEFLLNQCIEEMNEALIVNSHHFRHAPYH